MVKQKLYDKRVEKKLTQEELAYKIGMETSSYNRRENGNTKISKKEWDSIVKVLEVDFKDIYEPEDGVYYYNNENANGSFGQGVKTIFSTIFQNLP